MSIESLEKEKAELLLALQDIAYTTNLTATTAQFVRHLQTVAVNALKGAFQHSDAAAVGRFAIAMKAKLAQKRMEGRGGWDQPENCSVKELARMLVEHVPKGDPVDIANFAMMLHQREAMAVEHHPCHGGEARRALQAATNSPTAANGAAVVDLPPLPAPTRLHYGLHYSAEDMEAFARQCMAARDERRTAANAVGLPVLGALTRAEIEDTIKAINAAMNPAASMFLPRGWNVILNKLCDMLPTAPQPEREVAEDPITGKMEIMPDSLGGLHAELLQKGDRVSLEAAAQIRGLRRQMFDYEVQMNALTALPRPTAEKAAGQ